MKSLEERETSGFKFCHACSAELRKTADKYCRRCGARQNHDTARLYDDQQNFSVAPHTNPLTEPADFRRVSISLVNGGNIGADFRQSE